MKCLMHVLKGVGWMLALMTAFLTVMAVLVGTTAGIVRVFDLPQWAGVLVFIILDAIAVGCFIGVMECLQERKIHG